MSCVVSGAQSASHTREREVRGTHKVCSFWAWRVIRSSQRAGEKGPYHPYGLLPLWVQKPLGGGKRVSGWLLQPQGAGRGRSGPDGWTLSTAFYLPVHRMLPCPWLHSSQDRWPPRRDPRDHAPPPPAGPMVHSLEESGHGPHLLSPPASSPRVPAAGPACPPASRGTISGRVGGHD